MSTVNGRPDLCLQTHTVLHQTPAGRREPTLWGFVCGTGLMRCTLAPSNAVTFDAVN